MVLVIFVDSYTKGKSFSLEMSDNLSKCKSLNRGKELEPDFWFDMNLIALFCSLNIDFLYGLCAPK